MKKTWIREILLVSRNTSATASKIYHFTCTAEDPRKIRGRSAEDHRGSHTKKATPWRTPALVELSFISCPFYLHRGRSAEDLRKIRGRPPRKSHQESHTVEDTSSGGIGIGMFSVLRAPRKIRGRSAEDLRKTTAEVTPGRPQCGGHQLCMVD